MSHSSAPSRRMRSNSSMRSLIWASVAFMFAHQLVNPCGVPIVQGRIVVQGKLFAVAVGPQVRTPFQGVACAAACHLQGNDLGVTPGGGRLLSAFAELLQCLLPQFPVVVAEES